MAARTVNIKLHAGGASQVMAALGKVGGAFKKLGTEVHEHDFLHEGERARTPFRV